MEIDNSKVHRRDEKKNRGNVRELVKNREGERQADINA